MLTANLGQKALHDVQQMDDSFLQTVQLLLGLPNGVQRYALLPDTIFTHVHTPCFWTPIQSRDSLSDFDESPQSGDRHLEAIVSPFAAVIDVDANHQH